MLIFMFRPRNRPHYLELFYILYSRCESLKWGFFGKIGRNRASMTSIKSYWIFFNAYWCIACWMWCFETVDGGSLIFVWHHTGTKHGFVYYELSSYRRRAYKSCEKLDFETIFSCDFKLFNIYRLRYYHHYDYAYLNGSWPFWRWFLQRIYDI